MKNECKFDAFEMILKRTERVMVRAMCGQKIIDKKTEKQMNMLGLKETTIFEFLHRLVIG